MSKRLWLIITWPSAIITLVVGTLLLVLQPSWLKMPFMHIKLTFVFILFLYHLACHKIYNQLQSGIAKYTSTQLRIFNEVATLILFAVVFLIVLKNQLSWIWGTIGLVSFAIILMIAIKLYKKFRKKMIKKLTPLCLLIWACSQQAAETLPIFGSTIYQENDTIYHTIQDFELMDQDSAIITNATLSEQVYVADFFFTSCPTICPTMKAQMLRVYQKYAGNEQLAILSHTIDPEYDTIPLLKDYAERLGAKSGQWKFLWGDQDSIYDLAETSYMSIADEDSKAEGGFVHSGYFLLVDKERRIRGVYDGTDADQVDVLINDIGKLLKEYKPYSNT